MPRKSNGFDDSFIRNGLQLVFRRMTSAELRTVAKNWCLGDYCAGDGFASRGLLPVNVIIAALIEIEHPLLLDSESGHFIGFTACVVAVLSVEISGRAVEVPLISASKPKPKPEAARVAVDNAVIYL